MTGAQTVTTAATPPTPSLTRTLMRLRWTLLLRSFRKNWGLIIGTSIGLLYGIGALIGIGFGFVTSLATSPGEIPLVIRALGALLILAWTLVPLFAFGLDDSLSARRFASFGRGTDVLQRPIFFASLVSIPFAFSLIGVLMASLTFALWVLRAVTTDESWAHVSPIGAIAALVALVPMAAIALALCVVIPRAILTWRGNLRTSQRRLEALRAFSLVGVIAVAYSFSFLGNAGRTLVDTLVSLAMTVLDVLWWTPFGAPFSVPVDLAEGRWLSALARIAISVLALVLVWRWWGASFSTGQLDALRARAGDRDQKVTALVPKVLPSNALGAVAGKSLRYWRRDTRYTMSLLILPLLGLFFTAMSIFNEGSSFMGYVGIAITAWMAGILISNEVGFDGPSSWVNITAGIDNRANMLGRYVALGLFIFPLLLVLCIAVPLLHGAPEAIALTIPLSFGFLLSSWGVSILTTAYIPYPAPGPGSMKNSSAGTAWIAMLTAMIGTWLPMTPVAVLLVLGFTIVPGLQFVGAVLALLIGVLTLWAGVRFGAARLDRHYAEAFQATKQFAHT